MPKTFGILYPTPKHSTVISNMPRHINRQIWSLLFTTTVLVTQPALGQSEPARALTTATTSSQFEDLKTSGASQSTYLNQDFRITKAKAPRPNLTEFRKRIEPLLKNKCIDCHGPETTEGNIRIDTLNPDLQKGPDVSWWLEVLAVLNNGEMPPPDDVDLSDDDRSAIINWLSDEIQIASTVHRAEQGHSSFRRMTRYEYNFALQDILGLPYDFAKDLPPEAFSEDGFQNSAEMLHMTSIQFETYRTIARKALERATVIGEKPQTLYWGVTMKDAAAREWPKQQEQLDKAKEQFKDDPAKLKQELERLNASFKNPHNNTYYKDLRNGRTAQFNWVYYGARYAFPPGNQPRVVPGVFDHVAIIPRGRHLIVELGDQLPDDGIMRVRARVHRSEAPNTGTPSLALEFAWRASNEGRAIIPVSKRDIPVDVGQGNAQIYQWDVPLGEIYPRNSVKGVTKMGSMPSPSEYIRFVNNSVAQGDIHIDYVEVSTPVFDQWPPESHKRIFIESDNAENEEVYASEVLAHFIPKAWRRQITADELDRKLDLFNSIRPQCDTFEEAIIEVLSTVLSSPNLLYVAGTETAGRTKGRSSSLSDTDLAARLSMLLWSSTPDEQLLQLAANGSINDPIILEEQVERLLADDRSRRFSTQFVRQWLDLQILEFLAIDRKVRPQFDPMLKKAMLEEPTEFFHEVLSNNASILDFLHANYMVINEKLAVHYGIAGVLGNDFRRVELDDAQISQRGGLLTQAGLLTMNSSGADSHPLKRGIWLLESILNDPPPPPPPAVPEIDLADPEIAKMTLKERIEDHRNHAACMSCHAKIDPWGIAFENFDALGRWRNDIKGQTVDATSTLFNNQTLAGMNGLKTYLLTNRQDQFARALVFKMSTYALGRPLTFGDRSSVDQITADLRKEGDGLATMIKLIVTSDLFKSR